MQLCGHLNSPSRATCEECGFDLSASPDWGVDYDDLNYDCRWGMNVFG